MLKNFAARFIYTTRNIVIEIFAYSSLWLKY